MIRPPYNFSGGNSLDYEELVELKKRIEFNRTETSIIKLVREANHRRKTPKKMQCLKRALKSLMKFQNRKILFIEDDLPNKFTN